MKGISILITVLIFSGCNQFDWSNVQVVSPDGTKVITIITKEKSRYIIPGNYNSIPDDNFAVIDISNIDPIGDEIGICWNYEDKEWMFVNAYGVKTIDKTDTSKFKILEELNVDSDGVPTFKPFDNKEHCISVMIRENSIEPKSNGRLIYK